MWARWTESGAPKCSGTCWFGSADRQEGGKASVEVPAPHLDGSPLMPPSQRGSPAFAPLGRGSRGCSGSRRRWHLGGYMCPMALPSPSPKWGALNCNQGWVGRGAACRGEAGRVRREPPRHMRGLGGSCQEAVTALSGSPGTFLPLQTGQEASQSGPGHLRTRASRRGGAPCQAGRGRRRARSRGRGGGGRWAQRLAGGAALRPQGANDRRPRLTCSRRYVQAPPAAGALLGAT